jgi:predicted restriction endonuclease
MKLTKPQREAVKQMFGCRCAYCGVELGSKWHTDHVKPVRRETVFVSGVRWCSGLNDM